MTKKVRVLIAIGVIAVVMGLLITAGFNSSTGTYLTIEEALAAQAEGATQEGRFIQMEGDLADGTFDWDSNNIILKFGLTDGNNIIHITYDGIKPDNIEAGYPIIVEGKFTSEKEFIADSILVKCPSRYEEE